MKEINIILSQKAQETFIELMKNCENKKIDRTIFNSILKKIELIKENPHLGNPIAKKLIPEEYKKEYGITNLFRIELSNYWRMLYTLTNEKEIKIVAFVIEILDHKKYNKRFNY